MSQIKISQLPLLPNISSNTSNTLFVGVDVPSGITGKFTATLLSQQLYANNQLIVGNNQILFANTIGQLSGYDPQFLQLNMQNFNPNGSGDYIVTADIGTNQYGYVDMGINNSQNYDSVNASAIFPLDSYLYAYGNTSGAPGGNLIIGTATSNTKVKVVVGGLNTSNVVGYFDVNGAHFPNIDANTSTNLSTALNWSNTVNTVIQSQIAYLQGIDNAQNTVDLIQNTNTMIVGSYANSAYNQANLAGSYANSSYQASNSSGFYANAAYYIANQAYVQANTALNNANFAQLTGNAGYNQANIATQEAVTSGVYANAAYTLANTALQNTTTVLVTGMNASTINVSTIYLANTVINNGIVTTANIQANNLIANSLTINGNSLSPTIVNSWTPTLNFATSQGSQTYSIQSGIYTKNGRNVRATFNIVTTAQTGTGNFSLNISSLPAALNVANVIAGSVFVSQVGGSVSSSVISPQASIQPGANVLPVYTSYTTPGGGGSVVYRQITATDLGTTMQLSGFIEYISAS